MTKDMSDFLALKALVQSAKDDPKNVGWYILKSYYLGEGNITLNEVLEDAPTPVYLQIVEI